MPFRAVSEYHLDALEASPAKLILLPSAHNVDDAAMARLMEIVKKTGATLLVTGPISLDAYWREHKRFKELVGESKISNVQREEILDIQGVKVPVSYGHRRIAEVNKEVRVGENMTTIGDALVDIPLGQGRLLWSPLPIELNDNTAAVEALYRHALDAAGCEAGLEWIHGGEHAGVYGRKIAFSEGFLYTFVSEFAWDVNIEVKDTETGTSYAFVLGKERSVLFATDASGKLLSVYRPDEVYIEVSSK
jgi:hypothetical protein